jgi:hypothetical protein
MGCVISFLMVVIGGVICWFTRSIPAFLVGLVALLLGLGLGYFSIPKFWEKGAEEQAVEAIDEAEKLLAHLKHVNRGMLAKAEKKEKTLNTPYHYGVSEKDGMITYRDPRVEGGTKMTERRAPLFLRKKKPRR